MLFKFWWQKEKLFKKPGPGIFSISVGSTNNIGDIKNNNEQKNMHMWRDLQVLKILALILVVSI